MSGGRLRQPQSTTTRTLSRRTRPLGRVPRVQAQEPHTGFLPVGDVRAHVEFGKGRESWDRWGDAKADGAHAERDDADPRGAVELL